MLPQKKCFKCEQVKNIDEFYKHKAMLDGHLNKCKECTKLDVRQRYYKDSEKIKEYDKKRAMLPHRVQARKLYAATKVAKEAARERNKIYRQKFDEKFKARNMLNNFLRDGKIKKPTFCSECNEQKKLEAHHHDYSKPLEVKWLCTSCHTKEHRQ